MEIFGGFLKIDIECSGCAKISNVSIVYSSLNVVLKILQFRLRIRINKKLHSSTIFAMKYSNYSIDNKQIKRVYTFMEN